ncbi:MAG TPA: rhamnogalacturonan acetylesterase [Planctomycetota bacterium]|jgi:lysophospholipase L1-like esterase
MRVWPLLLAIIVAVLTAPASAAQPAADNKPLRIVILGDSTVCDYAADSPIRGWGQMLGEGFKKAVAIRNLAASGRSTKTFIKEGRLKKALEEPADFALIQFGHNDSHGQDRPESTDAATDYKDFLRTYVDSFQKAGTKPILVTPMHRRTFTKGKLTEELRLYAEAMKAVAEEKKVPVVDLYALSGELFEKLGDEGSADLSCSSKDRTHFSEKGARAMAGLVLGELGKIEPRLRDAMK